MNLSKLNTSLSTLNFILCFVGYTLATTIFLPVSSDVEGISRSVTMPYRAFALGLTLLVILLNWKSNTRWASDAKLYIVIWILLLIRILYDFEIRSDLHILKSEKLEIWLYAVAICFLSLVSICKSYNFIDILKAKKWVFIGYIIIIIIQLATNEALNLSNEVHGRLGGGAGISTISFGHNGATVILLCLSVYYNKKRKLFEKTILLLITFVGIIMLLRSGSRGPVVALLTAILVYIYSKYDNRIKSLLYISLIIIITFLFINQIRDFIGYIAPTMLARIELTLNEGYTSGRDRLYLNAINNIMDNPILGSQFCLVDRIGRTAYSHNMVLDMFMGLGFFVGILFFYIIVRCFFLSVKIIQNNKGSEWIVLLLIQRIMAGMFSSALYYDPLLTILIGYILLFHSKENLYIKYHKEHLKLKTLK